jgi:ABC-type glycerol-3-phosphate transport system substrate-binding protein
MVTTPQAGIGRRAALGALAVGAAGYALWPIRPRHHEDVPGGRRVLTYWEKWTGREGAAMQRVVDAFNAGQDRWWVRRVPVSNIVPKSLVAIGGGDPPDVLGLFDFYVPHFAEANAIRALDEIADGAIREADYAPAVWRLLTHGGRPWAGVSTCHTLALYYHRAAFAEAGLDPDAPPRTVAELDACSEALVRIDERGRLERAGLMPNVPDWWPYFWPVMFGGSLFDEATRTATLVTPANVAAYEWVRSHPQRYGRIATQRFGASFGRSLLSAQDPFMRGRVTMVVQGPWLASFINQFAPDLDYGCAPVPVVESIYDPDRPAGTLEADVLMVPRGSRDPEGALEFIRFVQTRAMQEQLAAAHGKPSPLRTASSAFAASHPNPYLHVHAAIVKSPAVQTAPRTRVWRQYSQLIADAFEAIWEGAETVPELQAAQDRAQQLLDIAARRRGART